MKNIIDYLNPVSIEKPTTLHISEPSQLSRNLTVHTESKPVVSLKGFRIVMLGLPDGRMTGGEGIPSSADAIRIELYSLARIPGKLKVADLGNMKSGKTFNDTLAGLTHILSYMSEPGLSLILLGGSPELIGAVDKHYNAIGRHWSLTSVDSHIDFNPEDRNPGPHNCLAPLFQSTRSRLSHFVNIGYQTYLNDPQVITRLSRKNWDLIRLGDMRQAIHLAEPLLRDSDAVLFDIGAIREADAPGACFPSPNGLYAEEACLLARYAGVSDRLRLFFLPEIHPSGTRSGQAIALAAQIVWFFLESFAQKQPENPADSTVEGGRFTRYHINVGNLEEEMIFVKSNFTDRWWMELTSPAGSIKHISCSYEDYLRANDNEVPDRWLKASSRLKQL